MTVAMAGGGPGVHSMLVGQVKSFSFFFNSPWFSLGFTITQLTCRWDPIPATGIRAPRTCTPRSSPWTGSTGPSPPAAAMGSTVSPPCRWSETTRRWSEKWSKGGVRVIKRVWSVLVLGWRDAQVAPRWLIVAWPQQQRCQWLKRIWNWFVRNQRWLWDFILRALSTSWRWHFYYSPQRWNTKKYSTERSNMQIWINKYAMSTFSDHSNDDEGCENTDTI